MTFVRLHATLVAVQPQKKRFPWSRTKFVEVKREGFLVLNLANCVEIFAKLPNQHGVPLEITKLLGSNHDPEGWVPHISPHDYIEMVRALGLFGLVDLVKADQTIVYT